MIFVTIGAQEPFDRLIKLVDEFAPQLKGIPIVAQISKSTYKVKNMKSFEFISPEEFEQYFQQATLLISHAGMGTIISALVNAKPLIVMPRLAKFGETRNDHQVATAQRFEALGYVNVAYNEEQLKQKINSLLNTQAQTLHKISSVASDSLLDSLRSFIAPKF